MNTSNTTTNVQKAARLDELLQKLLQESLRRGFFGNVRIEFAVQDGTIQHIRRSLEQLEK